MKKLFLFSIGVITLFISCDNHPSFSNSQEAVKGCHEILADMQAKKDVSNKELTSLTAKWLETQDSAYSAFERDSSISLRSPIALSFFLVSDSIRNEIKRLAYSKPRSLNDVMYLKLNTAIERETIKKSDTYKDVVKFFDRLDDNATYPSLPITLASYRKLLTSAKQFKQERQLLEFIAEEDVCFRSLMLYLSKVSLGDLQYITMATTNLFDNLYSSVGNVTDDVNDRTMLYLTMRFNRRIIQNALACKTDIENNKRLDLEQRANYRWMLVQPFMAIDDYSTAVLTDSQRSQLLDLTDELPSLLDKLENEKSNANDKAKLSEALAKYFLKAYLSTNL